MGKTFGEILAKSLVKSAIKAGMGVQPPENIKEFGQLVAAKTASKAITEKVVNSLTNKFSKK